MIRRARVMLGAIAVSLAMGVGLVGPASAAGITPIKPIKPPANVTPIKPPPAAPKGPRIPFKGWSPSKIKSTSVKAGKSASSVRVQVTLLGDGETVTMDSTYTRSAGKWRMSSNKQGSVTFVRVANRLFMTADAKFYLSTNDGGEDDITPEEAQQIAGLWFELKGNINSVLKTMTIGYWIDDVTVRTYTKRVTGKKISGKSTVGLFGAGNAGGLLYVAASGKPYPLFSQSYDRTSTITYSNYNKKVSIKAPQAVTTLNI